MKIDSIELKEEEVSNEKERKTFSYYFFYIKEYFTIISFLIFAILIIFDYFIFTDVLNLNQAYFFNNLLGVIAQEQPILLIFILLPILFVIIFFIFLFKVQFDYLNNIFIDNYKKTYTRFSSKSIVYKIIIVFISIPIILFGDIIVFLSIDWIYELFNKISMKMTFFSIILTLYVLYLIYNTVVLYLLLELTSSLVLKFRNFYIIPFCLGMIIALKLMLYPFLQFVPYIKDLDLKGFSLYIIMNLLFFFIPIVIMIIAKNFTRSNPKNDFKVSGYIKKSFLFVLIIFAVNLYFYNLNKVYTSPYNNKKFWKDFPQNSLANCNISLLLNPLKIIQDNEIKVDILDIKKEIIKKFEFNKNIFKNRFVGSLEYFYIPFREYRIIFIYDDRSNYIITIYCIFRNDEVNKLLDVGYIEIE